MAPPNLSPGSSSRDGVVQSEDITSSSRRPEAAIVTGITKWKLVLIIRLRHPKSIRVEKRPVHDQATSEGVSLMTPAPTPVASGDSGNSGEAPSSSSSSNSSSSSSTGPDMTSTGSSPAQHVTPNEQTVEGFAAAADAMTGASIEGRRTKRKRSSSQSLTTPSKKHRQSSGMEIVNGGSNNDDSSQATASGARMPTPANHGVPSVPSIRLDGGQRAQTAEGANSTGVQTGGPRQPVRHSTRERKPSIRLRG